MSWTFKIKQRDKVAFAFGAIFGVIILANAFVHYSISRVSDQFKSVYEDRLIPTRDISEIMEHYYQNRLLLEEHVHTVSSTKQDSIQQQLQMHTAAIESLVEKFEKTYLVEQESVGLAQYKQHFAILVQVQDQILEHSKTGDKETASTLYKSSGHDAFQNLLIPLHKLLELQGEVGEELYVSADKQVKLLKTLSYLVIALSILIALIIGTLLRTTQKLKNLKPQKYQWN